MMMGHGGGGERVEGKTLRDFMKLDYSMREERGKEKTLLVVYYKANVKIKQVQNKKEKLRRWMRKATSWKKVIYSKIFCIEI